VVRAMDAIQQFLQKEHIVVPQEFVIGGASKVSILLCFLMYFKHLFLFLIL
jgi:hypothetical protein